MFQSPTDVAFNLFGVPVYCYGIILASAILVGVYGAYFLYKTFYDKEKASCIIDFSPFIIIIGILGARLYYCLVNYSYYSSHLLEVFYIRQGGLSIHGMIIVGLFALYFFSKKYKMSFLRLIDVFLCGTALGQSIGRWGNFFNSEAFGTPTDLPWKLYIPISHRPTQYLNFEYFHPTFLYESILDILIFILLVSCFRRFSKHPGTLACCYLILYSSARILVEHFRVDSVLNIAGIPIAQIVSVLIIFLSSVFLFVLLHRKKFED